MDHDRRRLRSLAIMRHPRTAGEVMLILRAVNRVRTPPPRLVGVVKQLRVVLEEHMMGNMRRTKRLTLNGTIEDVAKAFVHAPAWTEAQDLVVHSLALSYLKKGFKVLVLPDVSDLPHGGCVTNVPSNGMDREPRSSGGEGS